MLDRTTSDIEKMIGGDIRVVKSLLLPKYVLMRYHGKIVIELPDSYFDSRLTSDSELKETIINFLAYRRDWLWNTLLFGSLLLAIGCAVLATVDVFESPVASITFSNTTFNMMGTLICLLCLDFLYLKFANSRKKRYTDLVKKELNAAQM